MRLYRRGLIIGALIGLFLALCGAFGTSDLPVGTRLAYWLFLTESGTLIGIGASTGMRAWNRFPARGLKEGAAVTLLIAIPLTMLVLGTTIAVKGVGAPSLATLVTFFAAVLAVTAGATAINFATSRPQRVADGAPDDFSPNSDATLPNFSAPAVRPKLLERMPPHFRDADLYAVQSEDHYLRVHTSAGSDLILFRMADALGELDGIEGARTHRSWWVARAAVRKVQRLDGRAELTLERNILVPVSRSFVKALSERGWFA